MKIHWFHLTPYGIVRAACHMVAGYRLCKRYGDSLRKFGPESIGCMTAAWNFALTITDKVIPRTIIDIGANNSQMCKLLAMACDKDVRVLSFEPNTSCNPIGVWHKLALADIDGEAPFYVPPSDSMFGSLNPPEKESEKEKTRTFSVRCARFDRLVEEGIIDLAEIRRPIVLKVDCEGSEHGALKGFGKYLSNIDWAIVEVTNSRSVRADNDLLDISRTMREAGFDRSRMLYACYDGPWAPAFSDILFWRTHEG